MWVFQQLHIVNDCQKINVVSEKSSKELFMIIVSSKTCPSLSVFCEFCEYCVYELL